MIALPVVRDAMASSGNRVLGKGRTIGTPKPAASPSPIPDRVRQDGFLSRSESTTSLNSQQSTPKTSIEEQDISSAVAAVQAREPGAGAANASSRLVCPICNDEMVRDEDIERRVGLS